MSSSITPSLSWFQAALLIAGVSIGAGMLGLPLLIGAVGFIPGLVINGICWLAMLATGLLYLEASYWMPQESHILSLSKQFLGKKSALFCGGCFLLLYFSLIVAYIAGISPLITQATSFYFKKDISILEANVLCSLIFGGIVLLGPKIIEKSNSFFMIGLFISFIFLVGEGAHFFTISNLQKMEWKSILLPTSILFGAYGYHNIVPSIANLMKRSPKDAKKAIWLGTSIPFILFSAWITFTLGICNETILKKALEDGLPMTHALSKYLNDPKIEVFASFFTFFALVTSLIGVSFSVLDFLKDGALKIKKTPSRLFLCFIIFAPTTLLASIDPSTFIIFLGIAGGFGETILNGIVPVCIVWIGRYRQKQAGFTFLGGGKFLLIILAGFSTLIIIVEAFKLLNLF